MNNELYSYDRWLGSDIYIVEDHGMFYGSVYENGTCYKDNVKALTPEKCLDKCKAWVEEELSKLEGCDEE